MAHIQYEERLQIQNMLKQGKKIAEIAKTIQRAKTTLHYEIQKGIDNSGEYSAEFAEQQARQRKHVTRKPNIIANNQKLAEYIADLLLSKKVTPREVIERLQNDNRFNQVPSSTKTIYNAIRQGIIPGVTLEKIKRTESVKYNKGVIRLPHSIIREIGWEDGVELTCEVQKDMLVIKIMERD